jgi:CubicO group peptidase (beta-lactamase class C family)
MKEQIDALFEAWQAPGPGGQVYVVKDGRTLYGKCFGYADIEAHAPVTAETRFFVASVSKQITVICALLLWERGRLDIDADIRAYIADLISFPDPVTVRDLMNNVSGIKDEMELAALAGLHMEDILTRGELLQLIKLQQSLNFPPRSRYLYSNSNFLLLSEIVERVSGEKLPAFARKNIFEPLGMTHTCIKETFSQLIDQRALSYQASPTGWLFYPVNFSYYGPTGLSSTAEDFLKWNANFIKPLICKPETMAEMLKVPSLPGGAETDYACGIGVRNYKGRTLISHGGADGGFRAITAVVPEEALQLVILANTNNYSLEEKACRIIDIVLGLEEEAADNDSAGEELYTDRVIPPRPGCYLIDGAGYVVEVLLTGTDDKDGVPQAIVKVYNMTLPLIHVKGNRYMLPGQSGPVYFTDDGAWTMMGGVKLVRNRLIPCKPAEFSAAYSDALAGLYYSPEVEAVYRITVKDGRASLSHRRFGSAAILAVQEEGAGVQRYAAALEATMVFTLQNGEDGLPAAFTVSGDRTRNVEFIRTGW